MTWLAVGTCGYRTWALAQLLNEACDLHLDLFPLGGPIEFVRVFLSSSFRSPGASGVSKKTRTRGEFELEKKKKFGQ